MVTTKFSEVHIKKWDEIRQYRKRQWVYRGQASEQLHLMTSLERACDRFHRTPFVAEVEETLLREFRRRYQHYAAHIPHAQDVFEWFSLMQHHGAPTRLLDWTYSIYVAAYFALEKAEGPSAVWAIDTRWCQEQAIEALRLIGKKEPEILSEKLSDEKYFFKTRKLLFESPFTRFVCLVNAFYMNERLTLQRGVFLWPGDVRCSFEDNLSALPGHDDADRVVKLILPYPLREEALSELHDMNISRATLFPGLDGFAQTLAVYYPTLSRIPLGGARPTR
jgi:FRG domain